MDLSNEEQAVRNFFTENLERELKLNITYQSPKAKNMSFLGNLSVNDSFYYINDFREQENCTIIDNIDRSYIILGAVLPVLYFLFVILLLFICCKYKRVKNNYQKLVDGEDVKETNQNDNNSKIEAM